MEGVERSRHSTQQHGTCCRAQRAGSHGAAAYCSAARITWRSSTAPSVWRLTLSTTTLTLTLTLYYCCSIAVVNSAIALLQRCCIVVATGSRFAPARPLLRWWIYALLWLLCHAYLALTSCFSLLATLHSGGGWVKIILYDSMLYCEAVNILSYSIYYI